MEIYQGNHGIDSACTPSMHTCIVDGINSFDLILLSSSMFVAITFLDVEDMIVIPGYISISRILGQGKVDIHFFLNPPPYRSLAHLQQLLQ
jgi:hypothetical protein